MNEAEPIAALMQGYAQDAVDYVRSRLQAELDYSPGSIQTLEKILEQYHRTASKDTTRLAPATIDLVCKIYGAYIGEVIRRNYGGRWERDPQSSPGREVMSLRKGYAQTCPSAKVNQRILHGHEESVWYYYQFLVETWKKEPMSNA